MVVSVGLVLIYGVWMLHDIRGGFFQRDASKGCVCHNPKKQGDYGSLEQLIALAGCCSSFLDFTTDALYFIAEMLLSDTGAPPPARAPARPPAPSASSSRCRPPPGPVR